MAYKHGYTSGGETPEYRSWKSMRNRCNNPDSLDAERYSSRGITVCERWNSFENFLADMGERPDETSLDRIDNDKGYDPSNCKWSTHDEQARNNPHTKLTLELATQIAVAYMEDDKVTLKEVANRFNIKPTIVSNIWRGHSWKDALAKAEEIIDSRQLG